MTDQLPAPTASSEFKNFTLITYIVFIASILLSGGLGAVAGVIMAYVKRDEMVGTIYHNHMLFLIRTFWVSLIGGLIGLVLSLVLIGIPILIAVCIWYVYRMIFGLVRLLDGKPVDPYRWLEL